MARTTTATVSPFSRPSAISSGRIETDLIAEFGACMRIDSSMRGRKTISPTSDIAKVNDAARGKFLSVFGVETQQIGGIESYAREVSSQLGRHGWDSILCFHNDAPSNVRRYLEATNVTVGVLPRQYVHPFSQRPKIVLLDKAYCEIAIT